MADDNSLWFCQPGTQSTAQHGGCILNPHTQPNTAASQSQCYACVCVLAEHNTANHSTGLVEIWSGIYRGDKKKETTA